MLERPTVEAVRRNESPGNRGVVAQSAPTMTLNAAAPRAQFDRLEFAVGKPFGSAQQHLDGYWMSCSIVAAKREVLHGTYAPRSLDFFYGLRPGIYSNAHCCRR